MTRVDELQGKTFDETFDEFLCDAIKLQTELDRMASAGLSAMLKAAFESADHARDDRTRRIVIVLHSIAEQFAKRLDQSHRELDEIAALVASVEAEQREVN